MKIAIGGISQETNSFSQVRCDLPFFRRSGLIYFVEGEQIFRELAGSETEIGGFLAAAENADIEILPTLAARCMSSGPLTEEALEWMLQRILDGLRQAGPLDGVLLAMHGGMISENHDDATGYVLEKVREVVGPDVAIGASLDLHANPYPSWIELTDVLISYHSYPHLERDMFATGYQVAELVFRQLRGEIHPTMHLAKARMLVHPEGQSTEGGGPLADMQHAIKVLIEKDPRLLSISLLPVQPWLDAAGLGFSVIVITDGAPSLGDETAVRLAADAWQRRRQFDVPFYSPQDALRRALETPGRPIVLSDPADGVGGGSAGDGTHLLRAMLEMELREPAMLTCIDPEAVQEAISAGFNSQVTLWVGGKRDPVYNRPIQVTGRVKTITDASYHAYGVPVPMGPCVVLEMGSLSLVLISNTVHVINPWVFRAVGLEPTQAKIVLVKSPNQFREEFEPIAADIIMVDAPGICSPNYQSLPFKKITRPLYPWDDDFEPAIIRHETRLTRNGDD